MRGTRTILTTSIGAFACWLTFRNCASVYTLSPRPVRIGPHSSHDGTRLKRYTLMKSGWDGRRLGARQRRTPSCEPSTLQSRTARGGKSRCNASGNGVETPPQIRNWVMILTIKQVADRLTLSTKTVRNLTDAGAL